MSNYNPEQFAPRYTEAQKDEARNRLMNNESTTAIARSMNVPVHMVSGVRNQLVRKHILPSRREKELLFLKQWRTQAAQTVQAPVTNGEKKFTPPVHVPAKTVQAAPKADVTWDEIQTLRRQNLALKDENAILRAALKSAL